MTKRTNHPISYYEILQVCEHADDAQIRNAYHKLALRFHPDRNTSERKLAELRFKVINEAYDTLKTKEKREAYQQSRAQTQKSAWTKPAMNDNAIQRSPSSGFAVLFTGLKNFFSQPPSRV